MATTLEQLEYLRTVLEDIEEEIACKKTRSGLSGDTRDAEFDRQLYREGVRYLAARAARVGKRLKELLEEIEAPVRELGI